MFWTPHLGILELLLPIFSGPEPCCRSCKVYRRIVLECVPVGEMALTLVYNIEV